MGTHPIFESDFDCLTGKNGDDGTELIINEGSLCIIMISFFLLVSSVLALFLASSYNSVSIEKCADEYACDFFRGKGRMIGGMLFSIGFVSIAITLFYVFKSSKQITERNRREEQADN